VPVFDAAGVCAVCAAEKPKLGPLIPVIEAILEADRTAPVEMLNRAAP
jgi:hypothetical protein